MKQAGTIAELVIHSVEEKDIGEYTCICGDHQTTATLKVNGKQTIPHPPICRLSSGS